MSGKTSRVALALTAAEEEMLGGSGPVENGAGT
jgi:hypothetical protein